MVNLNTRTTLAQEFPETTFDKRAYAGKVGMQVAATLPGVAKVGAIIGSLTQLNELQKAFVAPGTDKVSVAFEMLSRVTMGGATLLAPGVAAIVTSGYRSFESLQALKEHLSQGEGKAVLLDLFRAGSNVVYIASIVSGNPVFMAVSLVAQGSEDIYEGATMLFEQLNNDEKDFVMIGAATLQIGLGTLRGYQGASIGARYVMTQAQKPQISCLENGSKPITGEMTEEQLDLVNKDFERATGNQLTYARFDDQGNIERVEMVAHSELCPGKPSLELVTEWNMRGSGNADLYIYGNIASNDCQNDGSVIVYDWRRPAEQSHFAIESLRGTISFVENEQTPDFSIWNLLAKYDDQAFVQEANQNLTNAIQQLAANNKDNYWNYLLSFQQEVYSQLMVGCMVAENEMA